MRITKGKGIKKTIKILVLILGGVVLLLLSLYFILQTSKVKEYLVASINRSLSEKINTDFEIGEIDYKPFNTISLYEVYIEDTKKDTLLYAEEISAQFKPFDAIFGNFIFKSIDLIGFSGTIAIDENGKRNFDFLIDAFSSKKTNNKDIECLIEYINIQKSSLRIKTPARKKVTEKSASFDPTNIFIFNIDADIALKILNKDSLNAQILQLSAEEKSGITIKKLQSELAASQTKLSIPKFELRLSQSQLHLQNIQFKYDSIADFRNFNEKIVIKAKLSPSKINLTDIAPFIKDLEGIELENTLSGSFSGTISNLRIKNLDLRHTDSFVFKTDLDLNGLPNLEQTFLYSNIKELYFDTNKLLSFVQKTTNASARILERATGLGTIRYHGNISGFLNNLVLFGEMKTGKGALSTDISLKFKKDFSQLEYNGTLQSSQFKLGELLELENVGEFSFYLNTKGEKKENKPFNGVVNAKILSASLNNYTYNDIAFIGTYDETGFNGKLNINDKNIQAQFNGLIDLRKRKPRFDFDLIAKNVNLHAMNLIEKYPEGVFSIRGKTSMTGSSLDDLNGYIHFDSINVKNNKEELAIDKVLFVSHTEKNYTNFSIESNYINGSFSGNFKYSALPDITTHFLQKYLPALEPKQKTEPSIRIDINLEIKKTKEISNILELPFSIEGLSTITGHVDDQKESIDIAVKTPTLNFGNRQFKNNTLHFWGGHEKFEVILESNTLTKYDFWNFSLVSSAKENKISTNIEWRNRQSELVNKGMLKTSTDFSRDAKNKIQSTTKIFPTEVMLDSSPWQIMESSIDFSSDNVIRINDFRFSNENRYLDITGVGSKNRNDSILFDLSDIDLSVISVFAAMGNFQLEGKTTGKSTIYSLLNKPIFESNLSVKGLKFNSAPIGDATVSSAWHKEKELLLAKVLIDSKDGVVATGECSYSPWKNRLDLNVNAKRFNIAFLSPYFVNVIPKLKGYASGDLYIGGPLDSIRFDGRLKANEAELKIGLLGTTYHFNDTIILSPQKIEMQNITVYDEKNNKAQLSGYAKHSGDFRNFVYDVSITAKNTQVLNLAPGENDFFSGKAYADAKVQIVGDESVINFNINATTKANTEVLLQFVNASSVTDTEFIQFVDHKKENDEEEEKKPEFEKLKEKEKKRINVKMNVQLEATPEAHVEFVTDPAGGDMISGNGRGNIRLYFDDTQSDIKMYGSYVIEKGNYLFTLQDVFRKDFKIDRGSSIQWSGDPLKAQVSIRAIYPLNASLKDLMDETLLHSTSRLSVPVECILQLSENLMSPTVKFGIELPSSDEGIKQIVRNIINTDEMMMRQIIYLLVFNRFYTPSYLRPEDSINTGTQEFFSLASTTINSHLNHMMSQFSNMLTLGVDVRRMDEENMEYNTAILFQPNDRWIVNGNFGVRDNKKMLENYNRFVTDIDIEYLLTKSGKLRMKAYNHTIDRAQLRTAKNTQGIGFMYKEDFNNVKDLLQYYWSLLKGVLTKKPKDETKN